MAGMSHRGRGRALCGLVIVALLGAAASACDDAGHSPVESPAPSVDGTPPSDRDSYAITQIDLVPPSDAPAPVADRVIPIGDAYVLLGHDATDEDGSVWVSSDLASWEARGGWIAGYAGVQRIVGLVEQGGSWVGAYNERPSGLPPLAWRLSTSDAGRNWHDEALPAPTSQPSKASGVAAVDGRVVITGSRTTARSERPVVWRTRGGEDWAMSELRGDSDRSVVPRQPFVIGDRLLIPGAALEYEGDEVVASKPLLWTSDDGGKTFTRTTLPSIGARPVPLFGLHTDGVDLLFGWSGTDAVVWRSEDDGRTWKARPESTFAHRPEGQSYPKRAVRDGDCLVLAGVIGDPTADTPLPAAMWRSCDAGTSWSRMATDELEDADATDAVGLIRDSDSLVLVTNSADDQTVRLLRLDR